MQIHVSCEKVTEKITGLGKTLSCFLFLAAYLVLSSFSSPQYVFSATAFKETGVISSPKLNVRNAPNRKAKSIDVLSKGDRVNVVTHVPGWIKIEYGGKTGFVRNRDRYIILSQVKPSKESRQAPKLLKKEVVRRAHVRVKNKKPAPEKKAEAPRENLAMDGENKPASGSLENIRDDARKIGLKIQKKEADIREFSEKELLIINGLNEIELSLNSARQSILSLKPAMERLNKKLAEAEKEISEVTRAISENEAYARKRLVALYKVNRLGQAGILASSESVYDFIRRRSAIERILESDAQFIKEQTINREKLVSLREVLSEDRKRVLLLDRDYKKQLDIITAEKEKRSDILKYVREKKSMALAVVQSLKQSAENLDKKIGSLEKLRKKRKAEMAAGGVKFVSEKGRLGMPVDGEIISRFGKKKNNKFNITTFQHGIDIRADRGEPVRAVFGGEILYASWLKGYGNLVIINHGESYYTLYAHAEELFKKKGDMVERGEVIATTGDSGSLKGPGLHFEVRYRGKSVNPLTWLRRG